MPSHGSVPQWFCRFQHFLNLSLNVRGYWKGSKEIVLLVLAWKPWTLCLVQIFAQDVSIKGRMDTILTSLLKAVYSSRLSNFAAKGSSNGVHFT